MKKPRDRVGALILKNKRLLLVTGYNSSSWWTPGGRYGGDETAEEALSRELMEELQVDPRSVKLYVFTTYTDAATGLEAKAIYYLVDIQDQEPQPAHEIDKMAWFSRGDFEKDEIKEASLPITKTVVPRLIAEGYL